MKCIKCKKNIDANSVFCEYCGTKQPEPKVLENRIDFTNSVNAAKAGEASAFQFLYDQSFPYLRRKARNFFTNGQDVEDILQDTYVRIFTKLDTLQEPEAFLGWAYKVCITTCLNKKKLDNSRREKAAIDYYPPVSDEENTGLDSLTADSMEAASYQNDMNPEAHMDEKETQRLLNEILDGLPDMQRTCILLWQQEISTKEIGEQLEIPAGTVKSNISYAKKKIKERVLLLEKQGTKLYGMAPIPFFLWLLRSCESMLKPTVSEVGAASFQGIMDTVRGCMDNPVKSIVECGMQKAVKTASVTAGGKVAGHMVAIKIISVVVTAAVLGTGLYYVEKNVQHNQETAVETTKSDSTTEKSEENNKDITEMLALKKKIDYAKLGSVLANIQGTDDAMSDFEVQESFVSTICNLANSNRGGDYSMEQIHLFTVDGSPQLSLQYDANDYVSVSKKAMDYYFSMLGYSESKQRDFIHSERGWYETEDDLNYTFVEPSHGSPVSVCRVLIGKVEAKADGIYVPHRIITEGDYDVSGGEDTRVAKLVPASNSYGYKIHSITLTDDDSDPYLEILDKYREEIRQQTQGELENVGEDEEIDTYGVMDALSYAENLVYGYYDIDNNGTDELFIVCEPADSSRQEIFDIYSTDARKSYCLFGEIGYRIHAYIHADESIYIFSSGGAFYNEISNYHLDEAGVDKVLDTTYQQVSEKEYYCNDKMIAEEEYREVFDEMQNKQVVIPATGTLLESVSD